MPEDFSEDGIVWDGSDDNPEILHWEADSEGNPQIALYAAGYDTSVVTKLQFGNVQMYFCVHEDKTYQVMANSYGESGECSSDAAKLPNGTSIISDCDGICGNGTEVPSFEDIEYIELTGCESLVDSDSLFG